MSIDDYEARLISNIALISDTQAEYRNPVTQVAFRAGFILCREYMARFVEQGGDAATAASIRANWLPQFDADPGAPALYDFAELVENPETGPWISKEVPPSREAACYAYVAGIELGVITHPEAGSTVPMVSL